jgi:hypothetical protein
VRLLDVPATIVARLYEILIMLCHMLITP